ncbi:hypothetical protein [Streptomyces sp. NPDC095602]|uniref:hypothetical protein n=1 Tax=unclassified Streptomyces TaxID=2593676 RepID=UPI0033190AFA
MGSVLREAAALLRTHAAEALAAPEERWLVDQDENGALVVTAYLPDDVDPEGVSGTTVLSLAYPDDPDRRTYGRALGTAGHVAALDPQTARRSHL